LNANKEFVDRILGKPTNNHNINQTDTSDKNVDPDEAQNVFDQVVNEETRKINKCMILLKIIHSNH
ncbi:hypothetical protein MOF41_21190, partial [Bacillus spizizenii]|nr:hypothetical protein [Bacillus spizizenii]